MTDTIWSSNEFDGILQETQPIRLLSRENKFKCKNSHFQSVTELLSPDHQLWKLHIFKFFRKEKDCQSVLDGIICSHKFAPIVRLGQPDPQPTIPTSLFANKFSLVASGAQMGGTVHKTHRTERTWLTKEARFL